MCPYAAQVQGDISGQVTVPRIDFAATGHARPLDLCWASGKNPASTPTCRAFPCTTSLYTPSHPGNQSVSPLKCPQFSLPMVSLSLTI